MAYRYLVLVLALLFANISQAQTINLQWDSAAPVKITNPSGTPEPTGDCTLTVAGTSDLNISPVGSLAVCSALRVIAPSTSTIMATLTSGSIELQGNFDAAVIRGDNNSITSSAKLHQLVILGAGLIIDLSGKAAQLRITNMGGAAQLNKVQSDRFDLLIDTGTLSILNSKIAALLLTAKSAQIEIAGSQFSRLDAQSTDGILDLQGSYAGFLDLNTSGGIVNVKKSSMNLSASLTKTKLLMNNVDLYEGTTGSINGVKANISVKHLGCVTAALKKPKRYATKLISKTGILNGHRRGVYALAYADRPSTSNSCAALLTDTVGGKVNF